MIHVRPAMPLDAGSMAKLLNEIIQIGGTTALAVHRPHLSHRGRRLAVVPTRVVVAHRFDPVVDGGLIDLVASQPFRRLTERLNPLGLSHDQLVGLVRHDRRNSAAHRGTLGIPRPNMPISSR